ncbi:SEC-C domain-containing protein [Flavobacterium sp. MC2016-06]|uniref:SEC-C domain-containing protein n=1 Tax=Flavobacterium sp. MC2016-06 TaxID=2676308 RepID=UPI0012BAF43D|nr:SEC-C domain-containing protein [Flavobacterium sp. MC2016-06]MBU3861017.1 SEC-C domain-containing protein [Flavobacterium sp. MC2016-06]
MNRRSVLKNLNANKKTKVEDKTNIEKLIEKLKVNSQPVTVPVIPETYSKELQCYYNVEQKIEKDGGKIHYGWNIHQLATLIEGEHHAVWENDKGELIDITPNQDRTTEILFCSDEKTTYSGVNIGNIRMNITDNKMVDDIILFYETNDLFWTYGERKDEEVVNMPTIIVKMIESFNGVIYQLEQQVKKGDNHNSLCVCGSGKIYSKCHSVLLKNDRLQYIKEAKKIKSKM